MKSKIYILFIILSLIVVTVFSLINQTVSVLLFYFVLHAINFLLIRRCSAREKKIFHYILNFGILFSIALYSIYITRYGNPYFSSGSDDLEYEILGQFLSTRMGIFDYGYMSQLHPDLVSHNSPAYVYLISLLAKFGNWFDGFHTLLPKILNSGLLAWSAVLAYRISKNNLHTDEKTAYSIALGSGLMPIMLYNSAHTFREIVIAFSLLLIVYLWLSYKNELFFTRLGIIITSILVIIVLTDLRSFVALGAGFVVILSWIRISTRKNDFYSLLILLLFFLGLILFGMFSFQAGLIDQLVSRFIRNHTRYMQYRASLAPGFTNFIFTSREPLGSIFRTLFLMFSPYLRISIQPEIIFLSLGTIVQIIFIPFLFFGTYIIIRMRSSFPLWAMFWGFFIGEAAISFSWRHLAFFYPLGVVLAGFGFYQWKKRRSKNNQAISNPSHQSALNAC